jgi:DNA-binding transcriptional MerR regulator
MDHFSISQLAQFSGIKAHTIRAWEQRYEALSPGRSKGNTRFYTNYELKRLLNIVSLLEYDYKISELCKMTDPELHKLLKDKKIRNSDEANYGYYISQLISAGVNYDEVYFEKIFANCILTMGFHETYSTVIIPLLQRLGLMWQTDKMPPAQEHFISNLICQKLFVAIDSLPPPNQQNGTALLFLPENEFHEIPLLYAHFILRFHQVKSIYLGANVPVATLNDSIKKLNPDYLFFFLIHEDIPEDVDSCIESYQSVHSKDILVGGNSILLNKLKKDKKGKIKILSSIGDLEKYIKKLV